MGQKRRQADEGMGAPLWMVTFSDCMNLLLTFFVLLVTFTSFDTKVLTKMETVFKQNFPMFMNQNTNMSENTVVPTTLVVSVNRLEKGSETPTLTDGPESNSKEETIHDELRSGKVFLIPSKNIFLANGTIMSSEGKRLFTTISIFLKEVSGRVVISENGFKTGDNQQIGLGRAWAAMEYFTRELGLDKNMFSISATSVLSEKSDENSPSVENVPRSERTLEIVLLERSIYN